MESGKNEPTKDVVVETAFGKVRGVIETVGTNTYHCFYGIPYAEPPLGKLRFMPPVPIKRYNSTINAMNVKKGCYRTHVFFKKKILGSEDCLYLNVFVPQAPKLPNKLLPVMVYLYGGMFRGTSPPIKLFAYRNILDRGVIVVVPTFRHGALGFFSLNDLSLNVTGNQGLKDQVVAFKWIQMNIKYFGGDESNVTALGMSSGAMSAHFHVLSPVSKGLIHKVILLSGSACTSGSLGKSDADCTVLARMLGCKSTKDGDILEYLQRQTVEDITNAQMNLAMLSFLPDADFNGYYPFLPRIEPSTVVGGFLTENPAILIDKQLNPVPMLVTNAKDEGVLWATMLIELAQMRTYKMECFLPPTFVWMAEKSGANVMSVENMVRHFYFGDGDVERIKDRTGKEFESFLKNVTDAKYLYSTFKTAKAQMRAAKPPIFVAEWNVLTQYNPIMAHTYIDNQPFFTMDLSSCCNHCEEFLYFVKFPFTPDAKPGSVEERLVNLIGKYFTNFAKYGDPNGCGDDKTHVGSIGRWDPVKFENNRDMEYFSVTNQQGVMVKSQELTVRMEFWDMIYKTLSRGGECLKARL